jgi:curved DNA-binding protein CbpA
MDLFDILKIPKESSETDIKKAYRKLAKKWHPDRNKKKNAKEKFQQINSAYKILINRQSREKYQKMTIDEKNNFINFLNKIFEGTIDINTLQHIGLSLSSQDWKNMANRITSVLNSFSFEEILKFYINPSIPSYDIREELNCSESDTDVYDETFACQHFELPVGYEKFNSSDIRITLDIQLEDIFMRKTHKLVLARNIDGKNSKETFVFQTESPYVVYQGGGDQNGKNSGHLIIKLNLPDNYIWKEETIIYQYHISLYQMIYGLDLEFQLDTKTFTYKKWIPHRDGFIIELSDTFKSNNIIDNFEIQLILEYNHDENRKQILQEYFNN